MSRVSKNLIYSLTGQSLVLVVSLVAVRFIFRRLGDDVFGILIFNSVMIIVLSSALELGVSSTIVREISSWMNSEGDYVRRLIRTASAFYWGSGILLVIVIWITAPILVRHWINLRTLDPQTATTLLRLMSGTALVILPRALYGSVCRGMQMMHLNNGIDVGAAFTQQAGTLVALLAGAGAYVVAAWISVNALLSAGVYFVVVARLVGWSSLVPGISTQVIKRNLDFTAHMMAISVLSLVHTQAAQVIVSRLLPIADFGFYGFASSTVSRAAILTGAAGQAAFPSFSSLFAAGERYPLMQQYRKLQDLVCYGTLPVFAAICFAALPVFGYVFSAAVAQRLLLPTAFLALGTWMNGTLTIPGFLAIAMGKPQIAVRMNLYALFAVLPVTVALIVVLGLPGAGFSWVFYHLFAYAYMVPRISRECLQTSPWSWYGHVAKVLVLGASTYGIAWLAISALGGLNAPVIAIAYLVATAVFAVGTLLLIGSDLKETLQRMRGAFVARKADVL
jgi:O-antigen/teichoic acid export membrane protein